MSNNFRRGTALRGARMRAVVKCKKEQGNTDSKEGKRCNKGGHLQQQKLKESKGATLKAQSNKTQKGREAKGRGNPIGKKSEASQEGNAGKEGD